MNLAALLLRLGGWSLTLKVPDYPKCIICVAPHTSNWDFILGKLAYAAVGRKAGFLMKQAWFFWPMGCLMRAIGGVPVPPKSKGGGDLVRSLTEKFNTVQRLQLAITPEGTRSRVERWRTGFLRIAQEANVPIVLGGIDYGKKRLVIDTVFQPTGDIEADMRAIKLYFSQFTAKFPEKFCAE